MRPIGRMDKKVRAFKPRCNGGGSKKGKPQGYWPWVFKVCADAIILQEKATIEAWIVDRRMFTKILERRMNELLPGWQEYIRETMPGRKTPPVVLLSNRVYKMYYNGTSARGHNHDPGTRPNTTSSEHWLTRFSEGTPLWVLHSKVQCGETVTVDNWKAYL